jgi:hypothetical protein
MDSDGIESGDVRGTNFRGDAGGVELGDGISGALAFSSAGCVARSSCCAFAFSAYTMSNYLLLVAILLSSIVFSKTVQSIFCKLRKVLSRLFVL